MIDTNDAKARRGDLIEVSARRVDDAGRTGEIL
jgi:hypothetical protein